MLIKVYGFDKMHVLGRSVDDAMGEFLIKLRVIWDWAFQEEGAWRKKGCFRR